MGCLALLTYKGDEAGPRSKPEDRSSGGFRFLVCERTNICWAPSQVPWSSYERRDADEDGAAQLKNRFA